MECVNQAVRHARFGEGRIQSCDGKTVTVWFENYGSRTFIYPDAFSSFLQALDPQLAEEASRAMAKRMLEQRAAFPARLAKETKTVRKTTIRKSVRSK